MHKVSPKFQACDWKLVSSYALSLESSTIRKPSCFLIVRNDPQPVTS